ncbi:mitochondrial PGP phosphatase [Lipomyces chichibuensis]|uniref:mitochondrial PGP phosphatase n=1 Tax=Lipomyces chichibuensis TaxID=1546026 RepID=UPI0033443973
MSSFNLSATLHVFHLLTQPQNLIPALRVPTFADLPIPLSQALTTTSGIRPDIRALVLDKDNCFAEPDSSVIYPAYKDHFKRLREAYPCDKILIVSNTAGTRSMDPEFRLADALERETGVRVLRHRAKKPDPECIDEIMDFFLKSPSAGVEKASQVAVVGDRILTDIAMANRMGAWGVWVEKGVVPMNTLPIRLEQAWLRKVENSGYKGVGPL